MSKRSLHLRKSRLRVEVTVRPDGSKDVQHFFDHPSKTDQSFKKDCDVNLIVKRFMKANRMNNTMFNNYMSSISPSFSSTGVVDGVVPDYQDHLFNSVAAERAFMSLPAELRTRFQNKPALFLDFVSKPSNRAEMASMGLLTPEATKAVKDAQKASIALSKAPEPSSSGSEPKAPTSAAT